MKNNCLCNFESEKDHFIYLQEPYNYYVCEYFSFYQFINKSGLSTHYQFKQDVCNENQIEIFNF
jgi:hypothetical protein